MTEIVGPPLSFSITWYTTTTDGWKSCNHQHVKELFNNQHCSNKKFCGDHGFNVNIILWTCKVKHKKQSCTDAGLQVLRGVVTKSSIFWDTMMSSACYLVHAGGLLGLLFNPDYEGNMFLGNTGELSTDYMASYSRIQNTPDSFTLRINGIPFFLL
jgi:hypothetical protein